jgi:pimeloyl-ACP methyl ester carboxylesterase
MDLVHTIVIGGGGVQLHVVQTGNPRGRPILFIHGFSQSWLSWQAQMDSDLVNEYRLVAFDLRGHGQSDKPHDGYSDCLQWADDVHAVIGELALDQPVLCGWSYGAIVILDYIRQYGESALGGIVFVDAITRLGSDAALSVLTPELLSLVPGLFSNDVDESVRTVQSFLRLCFGDVSAEDSYSMLGYNLAVPPSVRQALFSRSFDNDDLLPKLRKPVLVVHGEQDAIVKPSIVEQHTSAVRHAQVRMIPDAGHAPFRDQTERFNADLRRFCAWRAAVVA